MGKTSTWSVTPTRHSPHSPEASESLFIHPVTTLILCHCLHGNVSSLAGQCRRWCGTEQPEDFEPLIQDEASQLYWNLHNFCFRVMSSTAVSHLEPNNQLPFILFVRVPIYVIFTANLWAVLPCFNFSVSGEESWIFQSSEFFFFFLLESQLSWLKIQK